MSLISDTSFHSLPEAVYKRYLAVIDAAVASTSIHPEEAALIKSFVSECNAMSPITNVWKYVMANGIIQFRRHISDYRDCTTSDVFIAIEQYRNVTTHSKTYQSHVLTISKRFLLWLSESKHNPHIDYNKIAKLKTKNAPPLKTSDDVLTADELHSLFSATKTLRNRALLEMLYDSMGRAGEVATLKWGQIEFKHGYATVTLDSKTDKPRKVPLYTSHVVLRHWRDQYPSGATAEKYVFPKRGSDSSTFMRYDGVRYVVEEARKSAGITKKVTPHIFRHTRITDLMRMGVPEQTIKMLAWGTVTTDMLRVYAHLTPTDAENEMNRMMGITREEKISALPEIATPVQCKQCGLVNPKSNQFCGGCGMALSEDIKGKYDGCVVDLRDDPMYAEAVQAALMAMRMRQEKV